MHASKTLPFKRSSDSDALRRPGKPSVFVSPWRRNGLSRELVQGNQRIDG